MQAAACLHTIMNTYARTADFSGSRDNIKKMLRGSDERGHFSGQRSL